MIKYISNTTLVTYLYEIGETSLFDNIVTIKEVKEEFEYLKKSQKPRIEEVPASRKGVQNEYTKNLSTVDLLLLQTAKEGYVLVTDDNTLKKAAVNEGVKVLDTPKLIMIFAFANIISYEKALEALNNLMAFYNRKKVIKKAIKDLNEWR